MTRHYPQILSGKEAKESFDGKPIREEIEANFIEMLQSISRAIQSSDQGQCRICERTFNVMDLAGGQCEECRMNDEGRW